MQYAGPRPPHERVTNFIGFVGTFLLFGTLGAVGVLILLISATPWYATREQRTVIVMTLGVSLVGSLAHLLVSGIVDFIMGRIHSKKMTAYRRRLPD